MLSRRTLIAGAAALGAVGCGPLESLFSAPSVPQAADLTWAASSRFISLSDAQRELLPQQKYQRALEVLAEDEENPHGPRRGRYRLRLQSVDQFPKQEEFAAWLNDLEVDLVTVWPDTARALGERGVLLPLDRFIGAADPALEATFFPSVLEQFRQGALYALPVSARPLMMYYDADYFSLQDVPPVDSTWGWDDLVENAVRLTRRREDGTVARWGLEAHGNRIWWALWQNGAEIVDPETAQCRLLEPAALEALHFLRGLLRVHRVSPAVFGADLWKLVFQPAGSAPPAMVYSFPPMRPPSGNYRLAEIPRGKVQSVPVNADLGIAIAARSAKPEAAYTALRGLVGVMQQFVRVPAAREAVARLGELRMDLRSEEVAALQGSMEAGRAMPGLPKGEPAWLAMNEVVKALVNGDEVVSVVNQACSIVREYQQTGGSDRE